MRLIDADKLKTAIEEVQYTQEFCIEHQIDYSISMQMLGMIIDNAPTVSFMINPDYVTELQNHNKGLTKQLEEVGIPTGEWLEDTSYKGMGHQFICSECHSTVHAIAPYCLWCGAKMKDERW